MKRRALYLGSLVMLGYALSSAGAQTGYAPTPGPGSAAGYYAPTLAPPTPAPATVLPAFAIGAVGSDNRNLPPPGPPASGANPPALPLDPNGDESCSRAYWTVGGGFYFMTPYFTSNPAFFTGNGKSFGLTDLHQHMSVAPLAWIGHTWENGWGLRFRWFEFNGGGDAGFTAAGGTPLVGVPTNGLFFINPGTAVSATNDLHLNVYDFEATHLWQYQRWWILGSAGVRYAHYSQNYQFSAADPIFGTTTASSGNRFSGAGPTMGAELRRQIADSNLYLYGSARGSLLFGTSSQCASVSGGGQDFAACQSTVLPVGELEIGGEWAQIVGRMRLFAQLAFVGQAWCGGNNASLGISEFNFGTGILSNFGFVGGVFRAGVSF